MPNYPRIGELSKWSLIVLFEVFFLWEYIPVYVCHFKRCMDLEVGFYMVYLELLGFSFLWVMVLSGLCVCVWCVCVVCVCMLSCVWFFATLCQAPLSLEFSRREYWSRLPSPTPGHLSDPCLLHFLHWPGNFFFFYHCCLGSPIEWLTQFIGHLKRLLDWWLISELYV